MSNICIYGYGAEGQSTERFFSQKNNVNIQIFDAKTHPTEPDWEGVDSIFLSPGIAPEKVPKAHRKKVTNQVNYFLENLTPAQKTKIIGITGSKGKTTTTIMTTSWLQSLNLKAVSAGNIGHPILEIYQDFTEGVYDYVVLEISSFQAEIMQHSPGISIFLGLFSDHLDRHGNLKNYGQAKSNLWLHQTEQDHIITTQPGLETVESNSGKGSLHVSHPLDKNCFPDHHVFQADHFRQNLGTIKALGEIINKPFEASQFSQVVQSLKMPEHRLEFVRETQGIRFYNDAIASNPEAVVAAVNFFGKDLGTLILGGTDSGGEFEELFTVLEKKAPQTQIVITDSPILPRVESTAQNFPEIKVITVKNLDQALKTCLEMTNKNTVCLLSPGGKSFDQFPNYTTKGKYFKNLVNSL